MALNRWGYPNDVGLITRTDQLIQSMTKINVNTTAIETSVENVINNAIDGLDENITNNVNTAINEAKNEIIEAMPDDCGCGGNIDSCCGATKCDIRNAVTEIKEHIDNVIVEHEERMSNNINEIYNNILNRD